jgi:formylglycine-generating enzyme required for sulfatase activity
VVELWAHAWGSYRVLRGGSWAERALICRSAYRDIDYPSNAFSIRLGFRVVTTLP